MDTPILPLPMFFVLPGAVTLAPTSCLSNGESAPLRTWKAGIKCGQEFISLTSSLRFCQLVVPELEVSRTSFFPFVTFCFPFCSWVFNTCFIAPGPSPSPCGQLCLASSFTISSYMKLLWKSDATCFLMRVSGNTHFSSAFVPSNKILCPQDSLTGSMTATLTQYLVSRKQHILRKCLILQPKIYSTRWNILRHCSLLSEIQAFLTYSRMMGYISSEITKQYTCNRNCTFFFF